MATGTLHDPYTNTTIAFQRGAKVGESVQIDHIVPLAYAWDMGAFGWPDPERLRFANDPANLLAVQGQANQDKGDLPPAAVDAAEQGVRLSVRDAVHRGAARLSAAGGPGFGECAASGRGDLPDGIVSRRVTSRRRCPGPDAAGFRRRAR